MFRRMAFLILLLIMILTVHNACGQSSVKVNFQPSTAAVPEGYLPDYGDVFGDRDNGFSYGWTADRTGRARDRDINPDQRYDTLNHLATWGIAPASWEIELPNATYDVYIVGGDPGYLDQTNSYVVEGVEIIDETPSMTPGNNFDEYIVTVAVNDGRLTIAPVEGVSTVKICFVHIVDIRVALPVSPANDSIWPSTSVTLEWLAGVDALQHDVYFGEDFNDVSEATTDTSEIYKGRQSEVVYPVAGSLTVEPGKTYYWRIDEFDGTNIIKGGISSFTVQVITAFAPEPVDGGLFVDPNVVLSWSPGAGAAYHLVFFGDNYDNLSNADYDSAEYKGTQSVDVTTWTPPEPMRLNKTYFWRVDEQTSDDTIHEGAVWSFTLAPRTSGGLKAQYYASENLTGDPVLTRIDHEINFDWGADAPDPNVPAEGFSIRWTGAIDIPADGEWTFWTHADDGVRLSVNDQLLIEVWGASRPLTWDSSTITLNAGIYPIVMEFYDDVDESAIAIVSLSWQGPVVPVRQIVPTGALQPPLWAIAVSPANGAVDVSQTPTLQWTAGDQALEHDIYFGTDYDDVANADITTPDVYRGRQVLDQTTYTVPETPLDLSRTYYWRIDEVNGADAWKGNIWSFTTAGFLIVDDFESYNDIVSGQQGSKLVYETWTDGYDNQSINGSAIGYVEGTSMETAIVHGGSQSVPLSYNNSTASYSEVTVSTSDLDVGSDWTRGDVKVMTLWFYGDPNNAVTEQLYVKIDGVKVLYDGENADVAISRWAQWNIELESLGLELNNITTLAIGLERTGATGGSGTLLIDDIRLYKTPPPNVEALIAHYGF